MGPTGLRALPREPQFSGAGTLFQHDDRNGKPGTTRQVRSDYCTCAAHCSCRRPAKRHLDQPRPPPTLDLTLSDRLLVVRFDGVNRAVVMIPTIDTVDT